MNIDLTEEEAAALLRELDGIIENDRYFLSSRITMVRPWWSPVLVPDPELPS